MHEPQPDLLTADKLDFFRRMPVPPTPIDRGRVAKTWMPRAERLLDIGTSAGFHLKHLARRAKQVVALELDPVAVGVARERIVSPKISFLRGDATRLPLADGEFDVVTSLDVLEHVADPQAMVAEIARVLRPGGTWIVSVPYRGWLRWASPENLAADYPRLFACVQSCLAVRFWIAGHNACGHRHWHYGRGELASLAGKRFEPVRNTRRGGPLYALAYGALAFPPKPLRRSIAWAYACCAGMALDYAIPYGRLSYNMVAQFRRAESQPQAAMARARAA